MSYTTPSEHESLLNTGTPIPDRSDNNKKKRYGAIGAMLALLAVASFCMGRSSGLRASMKASMVETAKDPYVVFTEDEHNQLYAACGHRTICIEMYFGKYLVNEDFDHQLLRTRLECGTCDRPSCCDTFEDIMEPRIHAYLEEEYGMQIPR